MSLRACLFLHRDIHFASLTSVSHYPNPSLYLHHIDEPQLVDCVSTHRLFRLAILETRQAKFTITSSMEKSN
jgi:hypothetical protein